MKRTVVKTDNVKRFLAGIANVEDRGAPEACWLLAYGDAGYGKSECGRWWAIHNDAVHIRFKFAATPHWLLTDLVRELGEAAPAHTCEKLFGQAVGILARDPRPIVLDEVEHAAKGDMGALETIRDLSDIVEVPVILLGREWLASRLKRERQIWTRISALVEFSAASVEDVRACCNEMSDTDISDDVVAAIHEESGGHIREIVKAIANVERAGARNGGKVVTLNQIDAGSLCQEWQRVRKARAA